MACYENRPLIRLCKILIDVAVNCLLGWKIAMASCQKICVCLLNVSEGRQKSVIEAIAKSALAVNYSAKGDNQKVRASVLNIFSDNVYNRSVITIASDPSNIGKSVHDACCTAFDLIDLTKHSGGHPRLGAVDLVPIHPVSAAVTLDECGAIARDVAFQLSKSVPGTSAFLFGTADIPKTRDLVQRRKDVRWYFGKHGSSYDSIQADIGANPSPRYGLTGIGAIPYIMNCNVTIETTDVAFGRKIAEAIRGTTKGGLPGVQSMAFEHEGNVEIACNVQGIYCDDNQHQDDNNMEYLVRSYGNCYHVSPASIESKIQQIASERNISTVGTAIVGFSPKEAERVAKRALFSGQAEYWKSREKLNMM